MTEATPEQVVEFMTNTMRSTPEQIITMLRAEIERLTGEVKRWNADTRRLSSGLLAIHDAVETVPASVLRGIAYDIALNCIEPDVAKYQIERRAALEPKP